VASFFDANPNCSPRARRVILQEDQHRIASAKETAPGVLLGRGRLLSTDLGAETVESHG